MTASLPFVLRHATRLPAPPPPKATDVFDPTHQLWMCALTACPVVLVRCRSHPIGESEFGETTITETREGADQSEGTSLKPSFQSEFGETAITKTREGHDQTESTISD
jgi:hypothetical protein